MPDIAAVASTATAATAATAATGPTTDAAAIIDSQQAPFATALIEQLVRQAVAGTGTAVTLPTDLQAADPQKDSASPAALAALMPLLMGMAMPVNPAVNAGPGDNQAAGAKSTAPVAQDASPALAALLAAGAGTGTASATPAAASITNGAAKDLPPAATAAESSAILAAPAKAQTADIGSSTDASQAKDSTQTFQAGFDATLAAADPTAAAAAARHAATPVAASAAPEVRVDTPVGSRNWAQSVGDKVVWMVGQQQSKAELVLNPPQMGRIEVSLTVSGDQAKAVFISANPEVRQALDGAMPQLREVLLSAGINLGQTHVGADSQGYASSGGENADNSNRGQSGGNESIAGVNVGSSTAWLRSGRGLVDTFA